MEKDLISSTSFIQKDAFANICTYKVHVQTLPKNLSRKGRPQYTDRMLRQTIRNLRLHHLTQAFKFQSFLYEINTNKVHKVRN